MSLFAAQCPKGVGPQDFPVVTRVSREDLRAGDTLQITVEMTNRTESTQSINANQCPPQFVVLREDGAVVGPAAVPCVASAINATVPPGETVRMAFTWRGEMNTSNPAERTFLQPGAYRIQGFALVSGVGRVNGPGVDVVIHP
jgi:hypothetical protein